MYNVEVLKDTKVIKVEGFDTRAEANKWLKEQIKNNGFKRHAGHTVNYSKGLELHPNF